MSQILSDPKFRYNDSISQRLSHLIDKTGYPLIQSNGQRRFGPPPNWEGEVPSKGCEIFVGKLPRDCFEDELVPAFERIGPIYEMRLMMDFNGTNRGYGFVKYCKVENANRAAMLMDEFEIRPGKNIGVSKSVDNCRLFIGNIDVNKTAEDVKEQLEVNVEGLTQVIMYPSTNDVTKNRGFVFVEFESHRLAAMARRILKSGGVTLWGQHIVVDWAEPEPETDPRIMAKIRKLYIRNLSEYTTEETLHTIVSTITNPANILRVKKLKDFAFIHFRTRGSAELVLLKLQNHSIHGQKIEVTWARPPMYSKTRIALPAKMTLCQSLPPRLRAGARAQRLDSAPVPTLIPTVPAYCCFRPQPQIEYSAYSPTQFYSGSSYGSSPPTMHSYGHSSPLLSLSPTNLSTSSGGPQIISNLQHQMQNLFISSQPTSDRQYWGVQYDNRNMMHGLPSPVPVYSYATPI